MATLNNDKTHKRYTTLSVIKNVDIGAWLSLSPALSLRYGGEGGTIAITAQNIKAAVAKLVQHRNDGTFAVAMAVAQNDDEASRLRERLKELTPQAVAAGAVLIDALSNPMGDALFDEYMSKTALAERYKKSNKALSRQYEQEAEILLSDGWGQRVANGRLCVYDREHPDGICVDGQPALVAELKAHVLATFPYALDLTDGITANQLKLTKPKAVAAQGIAQGKVTAPVSPLQNTLLGPMWGQPDYWDNPFLQQDRIVIAKRALDEHIADAFNRNGQLSISDICSFLEREYGYMPSNLTAFVEGFMLKEYAADKYRSIDAQGATSPMSQDKLAEMIAGYFDEGKHSFSRRTCLAVSSKAESDFCKGTSEAWGIPVEQLTTPGNAAAQILKALKNLAYPVWVLEEINPETYRTVEAYVDFVRAPGDEALPAALKIGKLFADGAVRPDDIRALATKENCEKGLEMFITHFEGGALKKYESSHGHKKVLADIAEIFSVDYSPLWSKETGEIELRKLILKYSGHDIVQGRTLKGGIADACA